MRTTFAGRGGMVMVVLGMILSFLVSMVEALGRRKKKVLEPEPEPEIIAPSGMEQVKEYLSMVGDVVGKGCGPMCWAGAAVTLVVVGVGVVWLTDSAPYLFNKGEKGKLVEEKKKEA